MKRLYVALVIVSLASNPAFAQTTGGQTQPFNTNQLETLSPDDRGQILNILRATKLIGPNEDLSVLNNVQQTPRPPGPIDAQGIWKEICKAACDAAAAVAAAACAKLSGPAIPVCLAAVEAARNHCRSRC